MEQSRTGVKGKMAMSRRKDKAGGNAGQASRTSILLLTLMAVTVALLIAVQNIGSLADYFGGTTSKIITDVALLLLLALYACYVFIRSARSRRELEAMVERLQRSNLILKILNSIQSSANSTLDVQKLLEISLDAVMPLTSSRGAIYLLDESGSRLKAAASHGMSVLLRDMPEFSLGEGAIGKVAASGEPLEKMVGAPQARGKNPRDRAETRIFLPIKAGNKMVGVLCSSTAKGPYTEEERTMLHAVAEVLGNSLTNAKLYGITRRALDTTRKTQSYLESFVREAGIGVLILDEEGKILIANGGAETFLRIPLNDIKGCRATDLLTSLGPRGQALAQGFEACYTSKQGAHFMQQIDEDPLRPAAHVSTFPLFGGKGELIGSAATIVAA